METKKVNNKLIKAEASRNFADLEHTNFPALYRDNYLFSIEFDDTYFRKSAYQIERYKHGNDASDCACACACDCTGACYRGMNNCGGACNVACDLH